MSTEFVKFRSQTLFVTFVIIFYEVVFTHVKSDYITSTRPTAYRTKISLQMLVIKKETIDLPSSPTF